MSVELTDYERKVKTGGRHSLIWQFDDDTDSGEEQHEPETVDKILGWNELRRPN